MTILGLYGSASNSHFRAFLQKNPVGSPRSGLFEPNKSLPFVSADASTAISHTNYSATLLGPAECRSALPFLFSRARVNGGLASPPVSSPSRLRETMDWNVFENGMNLRERLRPCIFCHSKLLLAGESLP